MSISGITQGREFEGKLVSAVTAALERKETYIIARAFSGVDDFVWVHFFCKVSLIERSTRWQSSSWSFFVYTSQVTSLNLRKEQSHKTNWVRSIIDPCTTFPGERFGAYTSLRDVHSANVFRSVVMLKSGLFVNYWKCWYSFIAL